jgi:epoxyqueuosine reductase
MNSGADADWIAERARELGFDLCGVVAAAAFPELDHFEDWLGRGYQGEMNYLEDARRRDLSLVMAPLRGVIVCGLNYNTEHPYSMEAESPAAKRQGTPRGWISRYAWGDDYHEVMWSRLNALEAELRARFPGPFSSRAYADTGPIPERVLAKHAGLGWLGKNTLLLNKDLGSWLFLGVILTSLDIVPAMASSNPAPPNLCGSCRKCLDACPTGALVEPFVMDARRCISYLTIELRGSIPEEFREGIGWQVYGCDICQDVCPYNRKAPVTGLEEFQPRQTGPEESLLLPKLEWLAGLSETQFRRSFRASSMKRAKWQGLVRNACIGLGNAGLTRANVEHAGAIAVVEKLMKSTDPVIAESAQWAIARIT